MKIKILALLILVGMFSFGLNAQTTEDFETGYADGDTRFNDPSGKTFDFTTDFRVRNDPGIGANSSNWFFDSGPLEGNTNTPPSAIVSTDTLLSFQVISMYVWTSDDDGANDVSGPITFTGTLFGGGTVSETITISPTGITGADWVFVDFAGTALAGEQLSKISFTYGGTINYMAGDDFKYILSNSTGIADHAYNLKAVLYPNPTQGEINVDLEKTYNQITVEVQDILGRMISAETLRMTNKVRMDIEAPGGLYFVRVSNDEGESVSLSVVKE